MSVCVLLPSARPDNLRRCLESLKNEKVSKMLSLRDSILYDFADERNFIYHRTKYEYALGAVWSWNHCYKQAIHEFKFSHYVLAADDLIFHAGWLDHALTAILTIGGSGLVAFNDLRSDGNEYAAHFLVSADFVENELGGLIYPPSYKSWWADREVSDIAKACGKYVYADKAIVEHRHYSFGAAPMDDVYKLAQANYAADEQNYLTRKAAGFPKDW